MKLYSDYLKEFGATNNPWSEFPDTSEYFAYSRGKVYGPFKTLTEASNISKTTERVTVKNPEKDAAIKDYQEKSRKADEQFHKDLREEYSYTSDGVYKICYEMAYDRGHSSGYDEVASYLADYIDFAERIIEARE